MAETKKLVVWISLYLSRKNIVLHAFALANQRLPECFTLNRMIFLVDKDCSLQKINENHVT